MSGPVSNTGNPVWDCLLALGRMNDIDNVATNNFAQGAAGLSEKESLQYQYEEARQQAWTDKLNADAGPGGNTDLIGPDQQAAGVDAQASRNATTQTTSTIQEGTEEGQNIGQASATTTTTLSSVEQVVTTGNSLLTRTMGQ